MKQNIKRPRSLSMKTPKHRYQNSSSRESCMSNQRTIIKANQNGRKTANIEDWVDILGQIEKVTDKVKKMCREDSRNKSIRARVKDKTMSIRNIIQEQQQYTNQFQFQQQNEQLKAYRKSNRQQQTQGCNSACHDLMNQCIKLNNKNQLLNKQKQALQKRLYFQSKEKRQLRWRLERQLEINKYQQYNRNLDHVCKINDSLYLNVKSPRKKLNNKFQSSQVSYLTTAKKNSPLRQKNLNTQNRSNNSPKSKKMQSQKSQKITPYKEDSNSDSLLIEMSVQDKKNTEQSKMNKSISLQKDLNQLLQICKHETNQQKKKIIRKQMQKVAFQIKNLRQL